MQSHKMNIEEIKQLLREEQIRSLIGSAIMCWGGFEGDTVSLNTKPYVWYHHVWVRTFYRRSGWSRTTFNKRWKELSDEGFVNVCKSHSSSGTIDSEEWRTKISGLIVESLKRHGLSTERQPVSYFNISEITRNTLTEVLNALTPMGA